MLEYSRGNITANLMLLCLCCVAEREQHKQASERVTQLEHKLHASAGLVQQLEAEVKKCDGDRHDLVCILLMHSRMFVARLSSAQEAARQLRVLVVSRRFSLYKVQQ